MEPKKLATFTFNKADSKTACEFRFKIKTPKNSLNCADRDENFSRAAGNWLTAQEARRFDLCSNSGEEAATS